MKSKDFAVLAKRLPSLAGFAVKGPLAAMPPFKHVLKGAYFEKSGFDASSFHVWAFFLPLFVPAENIYFNLGRRLRTPGGGDRWDRDMPELTKHLCAAWDRQGLPDLAGIEGPLDIAVAAEKMKSASDPYVQQAIAYGWARGGDVAKAGHELDRLIEMLDPGISWHAALRSRAELLKTRLAEEPAKAVQQLDTWEGETIRRLGLDQFK